MTYDDWFKLYVHHIFPHLNLMQPFSRVGAHGSFAGSVSISLQGWIDGSLTLSTDANVPCHSRSLCNDEVVFRLSKGGRVEADRYDNAWARQCQSKVVQKLLKVSTKLKRFYKKSWNVKCECVCSTHTLTPTRRSMDAHCKNDFLLFYRFSSFKGW